MERRPTNPRSLAEAAERISNEKYRADFEAHHIGEPGAFRVSYAFDGRVDWVLR